MADLINNNERLRDIRAKLNATLNPFVSRDAFGLASIPAAVALVNIFEGGAVFQAVRDSAGEWIDGDGEKWRPRLLATVEEIESLRDETAGLKAAADQTLADTQAAAATVVADALALVVPGATAAAVTEAVSQVDAALDDKVTEATQQAEIAGGHAVTAGEKAAEAAASVGQRKWALVYPTAFAHTHKIPIIRTPKGWTTDFNIRSLRPTRANRYYVNPITGSDANAGTAAAPFATVAYALGLTGDNEIIVAAGTYDYSKGPKGVNPGRGVSIICEGGIAVFNSRGVTRNWVPDATYPGLYSTTPRTVSGETIGNAMGDLRPFYRTPARGSTSYGLLMPTTNGLAALQSGSYGLRESGDVMWGRLPNSDNPRDFLETLVVPSGQRVIDISCLSGDHTIYLEGIHAIGGFDHCCRLETVGAASKTVVVNCEFQGARAGNGLIIYGSNLAYTQDIRCSLNYSDGVGYHLGTGAADLSVVEINAVCTGNGYSTTGTNNGSTIHSNIRITRLGGDHSGNQDRNLHDVGIGQSLNVGVRAFASITGDEDYKAGLDSLTETVETWLIDCSFGKISASGACKIHLTPDTTVGALTTLMSGAIDTVAIEA